MSIRELTQVQASNGTVIAGTNIDQSITDAAQVVNNLQPAHLNRTMVRKVRQTGYSPSALGGAFVQFLPWMTNVNNTTVAAAGTQPPTTFDNLWRVKGDWNDDITPETGADGALWMWESAEVVDTPHVLRRLVVSALFDSEFTNNMVYNNPAPPFHGPINTSVFDITVTIIVDDQYAQDDRSRSAAVVLRRAFRADGYKLARFTPAPGTDTLLPAFPTGSAEGFMFDVASADGEQLDIPIPAKSRVRVIVSIPEYPVAAWSSWSGYPFSQNTWGATVWLDEPTGSSNG